MLRAVIFDLDGVIVDSHPAHLRAWRIFLESLGKQVSEQDLRFVMEGQKREAILRHFLGELTDEEVKRLGARKEALFRDSMAELKVVEGFPTFLDCVEDAGLPVALASCASRGRAEYILNQLDLKRRFKVIVTGDDVIYGKPDPAVFQLAAAGLKVPPADILVCEDAVHGVEAAKKAGMKCLGIAADGRAQMLEKAGADWVVSDFTGASPAQLAGLFSGIGA